MYIIEYMRGESYSIFRVSSPSRHSEHGTNPNKNKKIMKKNEALHRQGQDPPRLHDPKTIGDEISDGGTNGRREKP